MTEEQRELEAAANEASQRLQGTVARALAALDRAVACMVRAGTADEMLEARLILIDGLREVSEALRPRP